jgi:hypothetical protein
MDPNRVVIIDGEGRFKLSLERVRRHLGRSEKERVLVGAVNDASALGAARAFQEAGRAKQCAIMGQNAEPDARAEMRDPRTPMIGSVAYFPERYGEGSSASPSISSRGARRRPQIRAASGHHASHPITIRTTSSYIRWCARLTSAVGLACYFAPASGRLNHCRFRTVTPRGPP